MDQWDRMESPKSNPGVHVQLTSDKGAKSARQNKESSSNKLLGKSEKHVENSERGPCLTQKNSLRTGQHLNIGPGTITLLGEDGEGLTDTVLGSDIFIYMMPKAWTTADVNKWNNPAPELHRHIRETRRKDGLQNGRTCRKP